MNKSVTEDTPGVEYLTPPTPQPDSRSTGRGGRVGYVQDKASERYAELVMAALPQGKVMRASNGEPVTDKLAAPDLAAYTKAKTTQKKVLDILAKKGVITQRVGQAALVNSDYRYSPVVSDDQVKKEQLVKALTSKQLGWSKEDALSAADKVPVEGDLSSRVSAANRVIDRL